MNQGSRPGGPAEIILALAALAVVSLLLAGAVLFLVAIGVSGWRVVPPSWPS